ncbi:hypothetical protein PR048_026205 [Dryococelus australis]|uniref:PiggyBac transposable element-derived protein domain-containing protein n=1 Tax=Dryococelus australis TaxID=614101 RepID=A0ABQ9GKP6_9NEOP|nr:hypothetical protein PR048_026205 [Dryococelus australis]
MRVVMDLVEPYFESGRDVTADNFFTSIPLAEALLCKKLMLVGTLRANEREIPQQFLPNLQRKEKSSILGYTKDITIVLYRKTEKQLYFYQLNITMPQYMKTKTESLK